MRPARRAGAIAALALGCVSAATGAAGNVATGLEEQEVKVVGATPLPGILAPLDQIPANVQIVTDHKLAAQPTPGPTDYLERGAASVNLNQSQGNPFQPDLNYRGFTASPLLGTPQGLSVFQDGVRINEGFGDVVNWDLIPRNSISSIQVIPGSNALFGLNTLGGALAVYTKSGFRYPGSSASAYGGSWGRRALEFESGGSRGDKDYFAAGNFFSEDGWREHSPSDIRQFFGKVGAESDRNDLDVSLNLAHNSLNGTQALPLSMLGDPRQAYTWPDRTDNDLVFLNLRASHAPSAERLLSGNVFFRDTRTQTFNSNVNDACASGPCAFPASNVQTTINQTRFGGTLQATDYAALAGRENQFSLGANLDVGQADFTGASQDAVFGDTREAVGQSPFATDTAVATRQVNAALFAIDTFSLTSKLHLIASGSYNIAHISIEDRSGSQPDLNGTHRFERFNPSAGLAFSPARGQTWYANYSEGMRAPTAMELTCADPSAPCRLPNIFLADPPLEAVLSRTVEIGARHSLGRSWRWSAAAFRTDLENDIQFVSTSGAAVNTGYFRNVGATRRAGLELGAEGTLARWSLAARYSFVDATFESPFTLFSPNNSSADALGDIRVAPGNRMPGIPRQNLKLRGEYDIGHGAAAGATLLAFSGQYARGDENNQDRNGTLAGYGLLSLDAHWQVARGWLLFATLDNVFDRRYATFAQLGANFFTGAGGSFDPANIQAEQFRVPGAPRAAWIGIKAELGPGAAAR
ncbi:MAG TPA: TonB-dependent receptor [Burkholderiales bacterium]|nr:TonB-dependent receptor [Burkholderiales bacterium]